MKVIIGIKNFRQRFKRPVLTLGMFDGLHLAHQRIIKEVVRQAKILNGTAIVMTFSPHPLRIIKKRSITAPLITSLEHRIDLIRQLNVDVCLLIDFDRGFSQIPAKEFIKHILVDKIGIDYLIVGQAFRFGKSGRGSLLLLKRLSKIYGFKLCTVNPVKINGKIISSSKIRILIQKGRVKQANRFLGREFSILGKVKKGSARGRILGYPTANIEPEQEVLPACGVYAVFVKLDKKIFSGILNVGHRPTFKTEKQLSPTIEVHIFNFRKKIYGKRVEVFFVQRIRPEKRFATHTALLAQIKKDEVQARRILKEEKSFHKSFPK
jgi:riboflavin kinase/FMN adenylyltransferase